MTSLFSCTTFYPLTTSSPPTTDYRRLKTEGLCAMTELPASAVHPNPTLLLTWSPSSLPISKYGFNELHCKASSSRRYTLQPLDLNATALPARAELVIPGSDRPPVAHLYTFFTNTDATGSQAPSEVLRTDIPSEHLQVGLNADGKPEAVIFPPLIAGGSIAAFRLADSGWKGYDVLSRLGDTDLGGMDLAGEALWARFPDGTPSTEQSGNARCPGVAIEAYLQPRPITSGTNLA